MRCGLLWFRLLRRHRNMDSIKWESGTNLDGRSNFFGRIHNWMACCTPWLLQSAAGGKTRWRSSWASLTEDSNSRNYYDFFPRQPGTHSLATRLFLNGSMSFRPIPTHAVESRLLVKSSHKKKRGSCRWRQGSNVRGSLSSSGLKPVRAETAAILVRSPAALADNHHWDPVVIICRRDPIRDEMAQTRSGSVAAPNKK